MAHAETVPVPAADPSIKTAKDIVETYLKLLMIPDPDAASAYIAPDLQITFTGGRTFSHPSECAEFNKHRYAWVKKNFGQTDVIAGRNAGETIVYQLGTLYGEWPDGTPFEGNRYVDRYVVRDGLIVSMEVWNDSAERILTQRGIDA
ncbi:MAG: nuclear transport factor 2 family protein [Pseudomonadota bacterium]